MTRVVDSHLHVWRLPTARGDSPYAWITPEMGVLYRDYQPEEAQAELAAASVDAAVLVQADDTLADTAMMLQTCDRFGWAVGVVGWVPLDVPREAEAALDRWQQHPAFRGVRHLVHGDPRADFLDLPPVRESLGLLAERELPLDVPDAYPRHLAQVAALVEELPELTVVVDHLAKPPLDQGPGAAAFEEWEQLMRRIARAPRAVAKVSGLRIPGSHYDAATLRPAVEVALEAFGPDRLMYGGDWPMTVPDGGYAPTLEVLQEVLDGLSGDESAAIWHRTAERVYQLPGA
ncbi:amidohydrolase family protein [Ornithinicoccus halotolerans]|uniref:amidohydrolase family protein n=1 Tax=Ornithinicoccus halotolerans TaxID=1748220 RepID=UPI00129662BC|nr:amidohydrolase family protein [Ornithinicoccus halotolerans]